MKRAAKRTSTPPRKLLDDFREADADETDDKPPMTDEEYVEMMVRKERERRDHVWASRDGQAGIPAFRGEWPLETESRKSRQPRAALTPPEHDVLDSEANARRKALETLAKHRKDATPPQRRSTLQRPTASEKVSPLRSCRNCYYCSDRRRVGGSWWCRCTNVGRSTSVTTPASSWVKGKINLPCWRSADKLAGESEELKDK